MEVKGKQVGCIAIVVAIILVICIGGHIWLKKTAPKREFIRLLETMRLVHERQQLDIEMYEQQKRMAEIKAEQEAGIPTYELTPAEPEKKGKKQKKRK